MTCASHKQTVMTPASRLLRESLLASLLIACGSAADGPVAGTGGAPAAGTGGASTAGTGGAPVAGAGGASVAGTGGASTAGTGGAPIAGTGGAPIAGTGGAPIAGSGGAHDAHVCASPVEVLVDGAPSGLARCADGSAERVGPGACRLADLSGNPACPAPDGAAGKAGSSSGHPQRCDDPCLEGAYGRPKEFLYFYPIYSCEYFCRADADCPAKMGCACGEDGVGTCVQAECAVTSDCPAGETCRQLEVQRPCSGKTFAFVCLGASDACVDNRDCSSPAYCEPSFSQGQTGCSNSSGACAIGRTLDIRGKLLVAGLRATTDWFSGAAGISPPPPLRWAAVTI